tara:strand:- start:301 stop:747 length:447 start_codon:yes stop_codon:yes gene_type:complete
MANQKISRDLNTREQSKRTEPWKPANTLPVPHPQDGYTFRWIRKSILGTADPTNVSKKRREGWEFCRAEDFEELLMSVDPEAKNSGLVEVGGLILCKIPNEIKDQRDKYYSDNNKKQLESVDNNWMRESDPRMSKFSERNTKVSFGKG